MIWRRVNNQNPCPICNRTDWCQFGDRAMKCMRVESAHACDSGGWYHFYGDSGYKPPTFDKPEIATPAIDAGRLLERFRSQPSAFLLQREAEALGVKTDALMAIGAVWAEPYKALAFPMSDGNGNPVGIRLRNQAGFKWAVKGSRNGVFVPANEPTDMVFLPEGPTSTAALLSLGLFAIGRPSCSSGNEIVRATVKRLGFRLAVIVSDNDPLKEFGGRFARPGYEGALKLQREIGIKSTIWMIPSPLKDARDFLRRGGTKELIESDLRNRVWKKL